LFRWRRRCACAAGSVSGIAATSAWVQGWPALLRGENQYEDKSTVRIEKVDLAECPTPARMREVRCQQLDDLERSGETSSGC
jgi:hypothetical protein